MQKRLTTNPATRLKTGVFRDNGLDNWELRQRIGWRDKSKFGER